MIASESGTTADPCTSSQCPIYIHMYEVKSGPSCKDKVKQTVISYGATSRLRVYSYKMLSAYKEMILMFDEVGQKYLYIEDRHSGGEPTGVQSRTGFVYFYEAYPRPEFDWVNKIDNMHYTGAGGLIAYGSNFII